LSIVFKFSSFAGFIAAELPDDEYISFNSNMKGITIW